VEVSAARADAIQEHDPGPVQVLVSRPGTRPAASLLPLHPAPADPALWRLLPRQVIDARRVLLLTEQGPVFPQLAIFLRAVDLQAMSPLIKLIELLLMTERTVMAVTDDTEYPSAALGFR